MIAKRLSIELLLAAIMTTQVQASFVPESVSKAVRQARHWISNHQAYIAAGTGLVAIAGVALGAYLWLRAQRPQLPAPAPFIGSNHPFATERFINNFGSIGSREPDYFYSRPDHLPAIDLWFSKVNPLQYPTYSQVDAPKSHECRLLRDPRTDIMQSDNTLYLICPILESLETNIRELIKRNVLNFATILAHTYKKIVDLIYFEWNGSPDTIDSEAKNLAMVLRKRNCEDSAVTWSIADGNSCILINKLAEELGRPITKGIHIGSPAPYLQECCFDMLYNLYSTGDLQQVDETIWQDIIRERKYPAESARNLCNVRVQIDGQDPISGLELRKALTVENLVTLLFDIDAHYNECDDLDACCFLEESNICHRHRLVAMHTQPDMIDQDIEQYSNRRKAEFQQLYGRDIIEKGAAMEPLAATERGNLECLARRAQAAPDASAGLHQTLQDRFGALRIW